MFLKPPPTPQIQKMLSKPGDEAPEQTALIDRLRRDLPYKMPKLFTQWYELSCIIGTIARSKGSRNDRSHHREVWANWVNKALPIYCISKEMVREFENTSTDGVEKIICSDDFTPAIDGFVIALPNDVFCPGNIAFVRCIAVEFSGFSSAGLRQLRWSAIDSDSIAYGATASFVETDNVGISLSGQTAADAISLLIIHCALSLAYAPELISEVEITPRKHSRHQAKHAANFTPRWIGRDYTRPKSAPQGGSHASPRPHWRAQHERSQVCGPKNQDRKVIKISATFVNG